MSRRFVSALIAAASVTAATQRASAVIVMGSQGNNWFWDGLPPYSINGINISQYEGNFNTYGNMGTAISPRYMVTATHVSGPTLGQTSSFTFNGIAFPIVLTAVNNDVAVWKIQDTFATSFSQYAPVYSANTQANQPLVVMGQGTAVGSAVPGGWSWNGSTGPSWGTNTVAANNVALSGTPGTYLSFTFTQTTDGMGNITDPNEATLSSGDSGGGIFVLDPASNTYKLAAVSDYIDVPEDSSGNNLYYSMYDARGYYYTDNTGIHEYAGANPIPLNSYGAQLSAVIPFLTSATPPTSLWTNGAGDNSWNSAGNWSTNNILTGQRAVADFTIAGIGGAVNLNGNQTVGILNFNNSLSYTINQGTGGTLTIDDTTDLTPNPSINVINGSHAINAPVFLANGLNINFQNSSVLSIGNSITGTGAITVTGTGTLTIATTGLLNPASSLTLTGNAHVALAPVASPLTPNIQTIASLRLKGLSQLDIGNNQLDLTTATISAVRTVISSGYANGAWNGPGIVSSTALSDPSHGIGYVASGSGVILKYTLLGDCNLDGTVNFSDLLTLADNYTATGTTWATGDFNYDGTTNFSDLIALASNYTMTLASDPGSGISSSFASDWNLAEAEVNAVPEPTTMAIALPVVIGMLARRRRRNRSSIPLPT